VTCFVSDIEMPEAQGKANDVCDTMLAGCAIMFFGYDASVMSLVNTNKDYLRLWEQTLGRSVILQQLAAFLSPVLGLWDRCCLRWPLRRSYWKVEDHRIGMFMGTSWGCTAGFGSKFHLDGICLDYRGYRLRSSDYSLSNLDFRARRSSS
jgi:hypothetical protein